VQPIANGALVLSIDTDFDGCMRLIKEVRVAGGMKGCCDLLLRRSGGVAARPERAELR
jgi:hypothetical protein